MTTTPIKCDFIEACYGRPVRRRPIWIMRQAGRYQATYRAVREKYSFEQVCTIPEVACAVTLQPITDFDLDAAIIFSDILVVFPPMGLPVHFGDGGPKIARPIRSASDVNRLGVLDPGSTLRFVTDAIRMTRRDLPSSVPLIGFSGAPFTLACYAIEGTTSREFAVAREFFYREPQAAQKLMSYLADGVADYLNAQIDAGVDAVQLFDSWGGVLSPEDYRHWILPHMQSIVRKVRRPNTPVIVYVNGSSHLIEVLRDIPCDVLSVDWRTQLPMAAAKCPTQTALQGNLDPIALMASVDEIEKRARTIMSQMDASGMGHVFNLGHGIMPNTPEANVHALVNAVHSCPPRVY